MKPKPKSQIPKSQIQKKKGEFFCWAFTKILLLDGQKEGEDQAVHHNQGLKESIIIESKGLGHPKSINNNVPRQDNVFCAVFSDHITAERFLRD